MSNQWFRMYSEFATDPKVQRMSEAMQRRLAMLFCLKCADQLREVKDDEIAFFLRISDEDTAETKKLFIERGFIDAQWNILKWDKRQFISDTSRDRVKKYREKRKSIGLSSNGYTRHSDTVTQRDGNCCVYCGSKNNLCIDHILPLSQNGNDDIDNLACACKACNSGKAGRTPEQAGYSFINKDCEKRWLAWLSHHVTVTVTPPESDTEQNRTEQKESSPLPPSQRGEPPDDDRGDFQKSDSGDLQSEPAKPKTHHLMDTHPDYEAARLHIVARLPKLGKVNASAINRCLLEGATLQDVIESADYCIERKGTEIGSFNYFKDQIMSCVGARQMQAEQDQRMREKYGKSN